jgi:hypothetical protein
MSISERSSGLTAAKIQSRTALAAAERANGGQRTTALNQLATQLNGWPVPRPAKIRMLISAVTDPLKNNRA